MPAITTTRACLHTAPIEIRTRPDPATRGREPRGRPTPSGARISTMRLAPDRPVPHPDPPRVGARPAASSTTTTATAAPGIRCAPTTAQTGLGIPSTGPSAKVPDGAWFRRDGHQSGPPGANGAIIAQRPPPSSINVDGQPTRRPANPAASRPGPRLAPDRPRQPGHRPEGRRRPRRRDHSAAEAGRETGPVSPPQSPVRLPSAPARR